MDKEFIEGTLLDESVTYTLTEICEICTVEEKVVIEMIEHGIVEPYGQNRQSWIFTSQAIGRSKKALRLHNDLAINWQGISLVLELLEEIQELRQVVQLLEKQK